MLTRRQWAVLIIVTCAVSAMCAYTLRSSRETMESYSAAVQRRYMTGHSQSRDVAVVVYLTPKTTTAGCALTLYSAVLMAYCPLRVRLVIAHAAGDHAADTAMGGASALMRMLRRRNMVESVCTHVEDHTTCVEVSAVDGDLTSVGRFSRGALVRGGVVMTGHWDQKILSDTINQRGLYACWAQRVEHTFGHVAPTDGATSAKQYVDRVFDDGVVENGGDDERPLFPQLLYGASFDERECDVPGVRTAVCLGSEGTTADGGISRIPVKSVLCSATMCFGPWERVVRCCTLLPVLCTAHLSCSHADVLLTAYLARLLSIDTYYVPARLMCRSFSAGGDGGGAPSSEADAMHLRDYLYADDTVALSFRRDNLGSGGDTATQRRRRMMGLVGDSKQEIRYKYRSRDMYKRVYRQRLREERAT